MTKSDVDVGGFGSFTDVDHRGLGLIGRIGMKDLCITRAPGADLTTESSFPTACCDFVMSGHQSKDAIDAAIVSRSAAGGINLRLRLSSSALLFEFRSTVNI